MKKLAGIALFLALLLAAYVTMDSVLVLKSEDIRSIHILRELPDDSLDVIFVGSSHVGMNIDNRQLYENYGIASMNVWAGMQPLWNSYYYAKECISEQHPKVLAVDVFMCATVAEYSTPQVAIKNVVNLRPGLDKLRAALDSFSTWTQAAEAVWGLPFYHSRYAEVNEEDVGEDYYADTLTPMDALLDKDTCVPIELLDYTPITGTMPLLEKNERYLNKLIDLCQSTNTQLLLITSPYSASEEDCMRMNRIEEIASSRGVPMLNCLKNYAEVGFDPNTDFYDPGHLSVKGIPKYTDLLGGYLQTNYDLPDKRLVEGFIWNNSVEQLPQTRSLYAMAQTFEGDGKSRFVDTGVKLYENRYGSWTLLARLNVDAAVDSVFLSCFSEEGGADHRGLLVRKDSSNTLMVKLGRNAAQVAYLPEGGVVSLCIRKERELYTVYVDGQQIANELELPCNPYEGTLLVGCQELAPGGEKFRFSEVSVLDLQVYGETMSNADMLAWQPAELPQMPAVLGRGRDAGKTLYALPEQFMGGDSDYRQEAYLDTNVRLYEESAAAFTLLARVTPQRELAQDNVFFSCFSEDVSDYRGLLLRQTELDTLTLIMGANYGVLIPCQPGEPMDLAVVKDADRYTIYVNGQRADDDFVSDCSPYSGTLLVGCQRDAQDELFRFSPTRVHALEIISGALTPEALASRALAEAPLPIRRVATSVEYAMPDAFLGNGKDRALDTNKTLYDVAGKDWTLTTELQVDDRTARGVYLSCFSEEPGQYRGFMIRQDQPEAVTVWLGLETVQLDVADAESGVMRLVLVKQGDVYTLYCNGKQAVRLESACRHYDGTLLVGCQVDAEGEWFRFSKAIVDELTLEDTALDAETAQQRSVPMRRQRRF